MGAFDLDFEDEGVGVVEDVDLGVDAVGGVLKHAEVGGDEAFVKEGGEKGWYFLVADLLQGDFRVGVLDGAAGFDAFVFLETEYH